MFRGDVAYDYDMHGNKIRKFVCTKITGKGANKEIFWHQVEGFKPETGITKEKLMKDFQGFVWIEKGTRK